MNSPMVKACEVSECAYNGDCKCHALAITVGDGMIAHCDTFCMSSMKGGEPRSVANVGACKVSRCRYNQNLTCHADGIEVGHQEGEVRCLTFCV